MYWQGENYFKNLNRKYWEKFPRNVSTGTCTYVDSVIDAPLETVDSWHVAVLVYANLICYVCVWGGGGGSFSGKLVKTVT